MPGEITEKSLFASCLSEYFFPTCLMLRPSTRKKRGLSPFPAGDAFQHSTDIQTASETAALARGTAKPSVPMRSDGVAAASNCPASITISLHQPIASCTITGDIMVYHSSSMESNYLVYRVYSPVAYTYSFRQCYGSCDGGGALPTMDRKADALTPALTLIAPQTWIERFVDTNWILNFQFSYPPAGSLFIYGGAAAVKSDSPDLLENVAVGKTNIALTEFSDVRYCYQSDYALGDPNIQFGFQSMIIHNWDYLGSTAADGQNTTEDYLHALS